MDVQTAVDQLTALPVADRIRVVQAVWDSIPADDHPADLTDEVKGLLDRRLAELDANPDNVLTWDQIKARVKGRA